MATKPNSDQPGDGLSELPAGLSDGRQSPAALAIARGTRRLLSSLDYASIVEFVLPSGRRADICAASQDGEILIVEVKSSVEDFKSDQKWPEYRDYCDRFYFAVDADFPNTLVPEDVGLIIADRFGAEIVRHGDDERLAAARRKAITLRLARAAAMRLHALADPQAQIERQGRF
ncbi:MAG: MmcB family DNA repair protein [Hyphomicrobiaceae bacterium]